MLRKEVRDLPVWAVLFHGCHTVVMQTAEPPFKISVSAPNQGLIPYLLLNGQQAVWGADLTLGVIQGGSRESWGIYGKYESIFGIRIEWKFEGIPTVS